ncbi:MAG: RNA 2',3'-cyclic phosphodiesterase [Gemmatimonadota bacterium]|jgi:2'-5' RNA ligase
MRLFVAINLPEAERTRLHHAAADLRRSALPVRWVARDALHLTLAFLGEVAEPRLDTIRSALERVGAERTAFEVVVGGLGAFPSAKRPRVVWVGIEAAPELLALQRDVEAALAPLGFEPEARPFSPHLTLGRARRDARPGDFGAFERLAQAMRYGATVPVRSVDLMQSHLSSAGARYERIARAPLVVSSRP